jgi:trehalose 6-phosphate phosphatase
VSVDAFFNALAPGRPVLVMLDFDGTVVSIRKQRHQVKLSPTWRRLLQALAHRPHIQLAFVSGRALPDLRRYCPIRGAAWVGNHGLHWRPRALGPTRAQQAAWRRRANGLRRALRPLLKPFAPAELESKGFDLTLHLRGLSPVRRRRLLLAVAPQARRWGLKLRPGRQSVELRPADGWTKGRAATALRRSMPAGTPCFFAGDDRTDEHAFRSLRQIRRCLTYKVGPGRTAAKTRGTRAGLAALLRRLLRATR